MEQFSEVETEGTIPVIDSKVEQVHHHLGVRMGNATPPPFTTGKEPREGPKLSGLARKVDRWRRLNSWWLVPSVIRTIREEGYGG